jgi:hypothetical protein
MLTIAIQLTSLSYGACPWDRAHIEGAIEVIPAPTRILRAIISGAFAPGFGDTLAMKSILEKMAAVAPVYYIPRGEYVALQAFRKDETGEAGLLYKSGKMNVEPYYAYSAEDNSFLLRWSIELTDVELDLLRLALKHVHYLGRSEHRAIWEIYDAPVADEVFNCRVCEDGDEQVQMVQPEAIESLYIAPGVRNAELKSGMPGFYTVSYRIDRRLRTPSTASVVEVDTVILVVDMGYALPATSAMYWCNKLHGALVAKSLQISTEMTKFRDGSVAIVPLYEGQLCFQRFSLYCAAGFTDDELDVIDAVHCLYSGSEEVDLLMEQVFLAPEQVAKSWVSVSPFFMPLVPSLKYGRGGRVRDTGFRLLAGTSFVKNGAEHQALKYFLRRCGVEGEVVYGEVDGLLGAMRGGKVLAVCRVEEWPSYWQWEVRRFSGGEGREVFPARPIGYRVYISGCCLGVRGAVSIGYGKNFGLGVLCAGG